MQQLTLSEKQNNQLRVNTEHTGNINTFYLQEKKKWCNKNIEDKIDTVNLEVRLYVKHKDWHEEILLEWLTPVTTVKK